MSAEEIDAYLDGLEELKRAVAYDASTGAQRWVRRYNGPANGEDGAAAVGVTPDGSEVVVGVWYHWSRVGSPALCYYDNSAAYDVSSYLNPDSFTVKVTNSGFTCP